MMIENVSPLHRLSELGQSVWIDYLSRELARERGARAACPRGRRRWRDLEPVDLRARDRHGDAYDEQLRELLPSG